MSHYFENDPHLASKPHLIEFMIGGRNFQFRSDRGVFSATRLDDGSRLLIETLLLGELGTSLLDLGSGIGVVGLTLATLKPTLERVLLTDINERAIALAKANIAAAKLGARVSAIASDLYASVGGTFATIALNPPIRAGKAVINAMYAGAKLHLEVGGSLYVVIRKNQGAASTYEQLMSLYAHVVRLDRAKGYHVYRAHD